MFDVYQMVRGQNPQKESILQVIGVCESEINRFRDCGLDRKESVIWILARTGSKNAFGKDNQALEQKQLFISRRDDSFDATYELLSFRIPPLANTSHIQPTSVPSMKQVLDEGKRNMKTGKLTKAQETFAKNLQKTIESSEKTIGGNRGIIVINTLNEN